MRVVATGVPVPNALSLEQIETIKATYAETGNLRASARAAECSVGAAKRYATNHDEYEQIRTEKRVDIIAKIAEVQITILETMVEAGHLSKASFNELGIGFGILTDKRLLLTGQATQRIETGGIDPGKLTPEEREQAARIRAKLASEMVPA